MLLVAGISLVLGTVPAGASPAGIDVPEMAASLEGKVGGLDPEILRAGLRSYVKVSRERGSLPPVLSVIDYTLPSTDRRLWVIDLERREVLFHELVSHGKNSGENVASAFGNEVGSLKTSLGVFLTGETYRGKHGYSLRLDGLERGINDQAMARAIVLHGASYVSEEFARKHGRLGRSWGCPALAQAVSRKVIDAIKDGTVLFAFGREWLELSALAEPTPEP